MINHSMLPKYKAVLSNLRDMGSDFLESRAMIATSASAGSDDIVQATTIAIFLSPSEMRQIDVGLPGEAARHVVLCQEGTLIIDLI